MPVVESFLPIKATTADLKADTEKLTIGTDEVQRQRVRLAGELAGDLVNITSNRLWTEIRDVKTPAGTSVMVDEATVKGVGVALADALTADGDSIGVSGDEAHDAAITTHPVLIGMQGVNFGANPTAITAGRKARILGTREGIPFVLGGHPAQQTRELSITAAKTNADLLGAVDASHKIVVTKLTVTVSKAATVNVAVRIGFAAATLPAAADAGTGAAGIIGSHDGIAPGGGFTTGEGGAAIGIGAVDEELRITSGAPTNGVLRVVVTYHLIAES
jgi:hypothetical protein